MLVYHPTGWSIFDRTWRNKRAMSDLIPLVKEKTEGDPRATGVSYIRWNYMFEWQ